MGLQTYRPQSPQLFTLSNNPISYAGLVATYAVANSATASFNFLMVVLTAASAASGDSFFNFFIKAFSTLSYSSDALGGPLSNFDAWFSAKSDIVTFFSRQ